MLSFDNELLQSLITGTECPCEALNRAVTLIYRHMLHDRP